MSEVRSADGTTIAYERSGHGPAIVIVDGALCSREFGPSRKLAQRLAAHFTVYAYDRRGRGGSGDTAPYDPAREVEDLVALARAAGGRSALLGLSSGGALALQAAAAGAAEAGVVAYEPPYVAEGAEGLEPPHEARLRERLERGDRGGAVTYFMRGMVGAPPLVVLMMRCMPGAWRRLKAVAHTLPYDAALMTGFRAPVERLSTISVPALVLNGQKTDARLERAARTVASAVPGAVHRELAGQTHNVSPAALAPAVVGFLAAGPGRR